MWKTGLPTERFATRNRISNIPIYPHELYINIYKLNTDYLSHIWNDICDALEGLFLLGGETCFKKHNTQGLLEMFERNDRKIQTIPKSATWSLRKKPMQSHSSQIGCNSKLLDLPNQLYQFPGIPTTIIKTMGVNITTIGYLRVLIIEIGSTIIVMVVEAQGIQPSNSGDSKAVFAAHSSAQTGSKSLSKKYKHMKAKG